MGFLSNLFWCIISILGGFLGGLLLYFLGKNRKRITYKIDTSQLVSNTFNNDNIEFRYNSKKIEDLYSSTIFITNTGNTIVDKNDLAPNKPISISTKGQFILNKSKNIYLESTNKSNNIFPIFNINERTRQCDKIVLEFDYIAKKETISCTLLHTDKISLDGILKDGKILFEKVEIKHQFSKNLSPYFGGLIIGFITYLLINLLQN